MSCIYVYINVVHVSLYSLVDVICFRTKVQGLFLKKVPIEQKKGFMSILPKIFLFCERKKKIFILTMTFFILGVATKSLFWERPKKCAILGVKKNWVYSGSDPKNQLFWEWYFLCWERPSTLLHCPLPPCFQI